MDPTEGNPINRLRSRSQSQHFLVGRVQSTGAGSNVGKQRLCSWALALSSSTASRVMAVDDSAHDCASITQLLRWAFSSTQANILRTPLKKKKQKRGSRPRCISPRETAPCAFWALGTTLAVQTKSHPAVCEHPWH